MGASVSRFFAAHGLLVLLLATLLPVYWGYLSIGVDISDEGYYSALAVSWLRSTPADTGNLSPHQFSAVLYYPVVKLFATVRPDLTGLILFMRRVYLCGSVLLCLSGYRFFGRVASPVVATAAALSLFVFIPLSLPTLSYNTLALFGLGGGLFTLARGLLDRNIMGRGGWGSLAVGAGLMAIGGCAYPSVAPLSPLALGGLFLLFPAQRRYVLVAFGGWLLCSMVVFTVIATQLGGLGRVLELFDFSRKLYAGNMAAKVTESVSRAELIWVPAAAVGLLGIIRRVVPREGTALLHIVGCVIAVVWWQFASGRYALFTKGHDTVLILTVGLFLLTPWPWRSAPAGDRLLAVLVLTGVAGGWFVMFSAVAGIINYPVLAILAVPCGLVLAARGGGREAMATGVFACVACLAWTVMSYSYAELPLAGPTDLKSVYPAKVRSGPYKGLRTQAWKAELLQNVDAQLAAYEGRVRTVDFWMSSTGLYLLTPFELRTPMPYWLEDRKTGHLRDTLTRFYDDKRHRPDMVVLWTMTENQDQLVNREQLAVLATHYREQLPAKPPLRIFLRNDIAP